MRTPPPGGDSEEEDDDLDEPVQDIRRKMLAIRAVKFQHYSLREAAKAYGLTSTTLHRLVHGGKLNAKRSRPKIGTSNLSERRALLYAMTQAAMALSALRGVREDPPEPPSFATFIGDSQVAGR